MKSCHFQNNYQSSIAQQEQLILQTHDVHYKNKTNWTQGVQARLQWHFILMKVKKEMCQWHQTVQARETRSYSEQKEHICGN